MMALTDYGRELCEACECVWTDENPFCPACGLACHDEPEMSLELDEANADENARLRAGERS